ncbi:sporulation integral membrane protein YtvI [Clostridium sp. 'White wine YQ']|uniref:sporulation integral membrane protein YtvI n=1 Tax=Clostridium sp. 'White wine YQ' TaxID=3027474 RepID=UPI0023652EED|nr:sporulation integral membrane protein YtvI [Clostridium sp. 'White wine YQ']MDD7796239.1 sporulation integral membrane protein YtvI [Clostridium sp. 'White wine YQ']
MKEFEEKISKLGIFFICYTLLFLIFFKTLPYTIPFVLASLFALILRRPTRYLIKNFKIKDWFASLITTILFLSTVIIFIIISVGALANQLINLTKNVQHYLTDNSSYIMDKFTEIQDYFYNLNIDPSIINSVKDTATGSLSKIVNYSVSIGSGVVSLAISIVSYIPYIIMVIIFTLLATFLFTKKFAASNTKSLLSGLPIENNSLLGIIGKIRHKFFNYALSYMFLIFVTFLITFIGFYSFRINYALILSVLCAILDLLPVLGMPMVYIPLAGYNLLTGNYLVGIGLLILYAIVFITRQILEPKIMSTSLGLNPIAVLAAIFIGISVNGVGGMIFCMFLVVFYTVLKDEKVL